MKKSVVIILLAFLAFIMFYFGRPVIGYGFAGFPFALIVLITAGILLTVRIEAKKNKASFQFTRIHRLLWAVVFVLIAYVTIVPFVTSSPMFHSQAYRELIGEVKNGEEIS